MAFIAVSPGLSKGHVRLVANGVARYKTFCLSQQQRMLLMSEHAAPAVPSPFTPIDQHLFEARTVFVSGVVDSDMALTVNRQLLALERADRKAPIVMWIDSPGGEVYSGFAIYDTVQFIEPRVITLVAGLAGSMGSVIALSAEKADRFALPNAKLLIHQPLISGVLRGSASDLDIHARDIIELKRKLHRLYAERTGTAVDRFQELMDRDRWVDPTEAIELGLISKVLKNRAELDKSVAR
jgi:ATP-dependent Clp protease protease subunit